MEIFDKTQEKLKGLKELDKRFSFFGANKHEYKFNRTFKEEESLAIVKRIQQKLKGLPRQKVIDSEWQLKNFSIKHRTLSLVNVESIDSLDKGYNKWKIANQH